MIAYSILTGQNPFKSGLQRSECIEKVKTESKSFDYQNCEILEKLVYDCIDENNLPERTFKNLLRQLKKYDRFLKKRIQKEEYKNYIEYIEYMELISYSEISKVYLIKDKENEQLYSAKVSKKRREKKNYHGSHIHSDIDIYKLEYPSIINYLGTSYIQTKKSRKFAIITEYMPNGSLEDFLNILLKGYIVPF